MGRRSSPLKWVILLVILSAAAYYVPGMLLGGAGAPAGEMPPGMGAPPVSVASVISKPITIWSNFSGMFEAVNAVEVRPRVGGQITAIHFEDGAEVKKGQPLFTIDPRPYEAAMISAKGAFVEAQAALARAKKLIASKAISQAEYEIAQSAYSRTLGNYKAAQVNLEYTRIAAPIAGKISRAEITVGNLVDPTSAPLLASIVDLSPIYASFDIDEKTFLKTIQGVPAAKLKTIPVEVGVGNDGGGYLSAAIHSFDNQITPGSGTIRVRAMFENADKTLVPGLYARVRIGSADAVDSILIHPTAVGTDQSKKFVMTVGSDNKAEYREVTLGGLFEGLQVITSGLTVGEKIIVNGLQRAQPGSPVTVEEVDMVTLKPLAAPAAAAPTSADVASPLATQDHLEAETPKAE